MAKKLYVLRGYFATATEDSFTDGEIGSTISDWHYEDNKSFSTKEDLVNYINENLIYADYKLSDFDWESGEGDYIDTSVLSSYDEQGGFYTARKSEIEEWKLGKIKLFSVHYRIDVMSVTKHDKYAKGGTTNEFTYTIGGL